MPTGIDQSWGFADPTAARRAGVQVVSEYLSRDPSKNINAADVHAYHRAGIAMLLNWENDPGAPLKGARQGKADAAEACRQLDALIAAVGYAPRNRPVIYFSCDRDVARSQFHVVEEYYRAAKAVCAAHAYGLGAYGEADLVTDLAHAGITDAEWQTLAWSGGVISPDADFYQSSINNHLGGASVDFDRVIHADELGAWWPPTSPHNSGISALEGAPTMRIYRVGRKYYVWQAGARIKGVLPDYARNAAAMWGQASIPVVTEAMHRRIVANQDIAAKGK